MRRALARVLFAGTLLLIAGTLLVAGEDWSYPPTISLEEIRQRVANLSPRHPRLLVAQGELQRLRASVAEDPVRQALAEAIVRQASAIRDERPVSYNIDGRRLLSQSRLCVQRVVTLATAYHLTGDQRYAARCQREMMAAARFPDWNPNHFLDVAEMTFALAIGYDWLYDQLEPDARQAIRNAIVSKGVSLAFDSPHTGWVRDESNWGQVCHGGLTLGALAVLEDEPELAARTVENALRNVTASMDGYAPSGAYPEGPRYWSYGTSYNVLLIAALESVFGSDFGLSKAPGFDLTGQFLNLVTGPSGLAFSYADSGEDRSPEPALFWLASRYERPDWLRGERERLMARLPRIRDGDGEARTTRLLPLGLLWWRSPEPNTESHMPLHWSSRGDTPISVHRSSWTDADATYVGIKAGSPSESHGQMDIGSFVLDASGVRWALDLGNEPYRAVEARGLSIWRFDQDSDRWRIFRQNNFGHNTLVIDNQLQRANGRGTIVSFSDDPSFPHSIVDMSSVYRGQAALVRRGVALLPSGEALIQDELRGLTPGSLVRWGMITKGMPERSSTPALTLRQGGRRLTLTILTTESAKWETINTARRVNDWDSENPDTRMVTFTAVAPPSGELTLTVLATPERASDSSVSNLIHRPLDVWIGGQRAR